MLATAPTGDRLVGASGAVRPNSYSSTMTGRSGAAASLLQPDHAYFVSVSYASSPMPKFLLGLAFQYLTNAVTSISVRAPDAFAIDTFFMSVEVVAAVV